MIDMFLNKRNRKATVLQFQKLCGNLNFLCRCIIPGRAFLRRLYAATANTNLKQHHHVRITNEYRLDLLTWKCFLGRQESFCRGFMEQGILDATVLDMYSNASHNFSLGFGAFCGTEWTHGQWDKNFCEEVQPSIEYLELFAVAVGVLNCLKLFRNKRIVLFCDNEAVVSMINNSTSKCRNCMILIRMIVLESLVCNTRVFARYVKSKDNGKADALSRLQMDKFWRLAKGEMNRSETKIPDFLWLMQIIWLYYSDRGLRIHILTLHYI